MTDNLQDLTTDQLRAKAARLRHPSKAKRLKAIREEIAIRAKESPVEALPFDEDEKDETDST